MLAFAIASDPAVRVAHVRLADTGAEPATGWPHDPGGFPLSRSVIPKVLLLAVAVAALLAVPATSATPKTLFPADCGKPTYKPKSIVVACGDANNQVTGIKWESYGTDAASGKRTAKVNDCKPNCASGKTKRSAAVLALTKPKNCGKGVTQFTRLAETFTGARPPGLSKRLTETFPCNGGK